MLSEAKHLALRSFGPTDLRMTYETSSITSPLL